MFLIEVEERFEILNTGLILTPGLGNKIEKIHTGDKLKILRPDKSEIFTTVHGLTTSGNFNIVISQEYCKSDIPIGSKVYLVK